MARIGVEVHCLECTFIFIRHSVPGPIDDSTAASTLMSMM